MEEPGPPYSVLFNQFRKMFPEISPEIIRLHLTKFGNNPEVCRQTLLIYRQQIARTQAMGHSSIIDTSITDHLSNLILNNSDKETCENIPRQQSPYDLSINCNQELRNYGDLNYPPQQIDYGYFIRPPRNYSYAGMETYHPLSPVPKLQALSAPVNSTSFECFNNTFRNHPTYTEQHSPIHNMNVSDRMLGTNPGNTGAALNSLPYPNGPPVLFSHLSNNFNTSDQHKQESMSGVNPPVRTPYNSQLHINVEPSYAPPQFLPPDQEHLSLLSNYQYWAQPAQPPLVLAPSFVRSPRVQNGMMCVEILRPPQISIPSLYVNQDNLRPPIPEEQHQNSLHHAVSTADERSFQSYHIQAVLQQQSQQSKVLKDELLQLKIEANLRREEIKKLEQQLSDKKHLPNSSQIQELKKENAKLGIECNILCMEVDKRSKGNARLGVPSVDFYRNIFTGQQGPILPTPPVSRPDTNLVTPGADNQRPASSHEEDENQESNKWNCTSCTFANHPAISTCEVCHMPRKSPGLGEPDPFLQCDSNDSPTKHA